MRYSAIRAAGWEGLCCLAFFRYRSQSGVVRVVLRSHFDPRDILQAQNGTVGLRADDDFIEIFGRAEDVPGARTL